MSRPSRLALFTILAGGLLTSLPAPAQEKDEPKRGPLVAVGKDMPFHVVDFVNGPHKHRGGCPSVMIANAQARGVVVWSMVADEPVLELVKGLDRLPTGGEKDRRFFVLWDREGNG